MKSNKKSELNENENMKSQILWNAAEVVLSETL